MTSPMTRSMIPTAAAIACLLGAAPFGTFAAAAGSQQRGRAPSERVATPSDLGLHGYSVVLVIGDMQAAGAADSVPSAARKALTDMQAFLPYKRYLLLDAAWMVCCGSFRSTISGRVRGPYGEYLYSIETHDSTDDKKLTVRFSMRDATAASAPVVAAGGGGRGSARGSSGSSAKNDADIQEYIRTSLENLRLEHSPQQAEVVRELQEAELAERAARQKYGVGQISGTQMEEARARVVRAQSRAIQAMELDRLPGGGGGGRGGSSGRSIMDSTFSIALGETVVIGTSRLQGDQALIALLTAATKPGSPR